MSQKYLSFYPPSLHIEINFETFLDKQFLVDYADYTTLFYLSFLVQFQL